MDSKTIIEVLDKLIGKTYPVGDSSIDKDRIENLRKLIDITNWCLDGLAFSAEERHSFEGSVRDNGELAYATMMQLKDWLAERVEDLA